MQEWSDDAPLVSVIVHTHREYAKFLPRALNSIISQTLPKEHIEVLVVHDGPDDDETQAICLEVLGSQPMNSKLFSSPRKFGYYTALSNFGIVRAEGTYVAFLDADNEWEPAHLVNLLEVLRVPDPDLGWAHFAYSRRKYVKDESMQGEAFVGESPLIPWDDEAVLRMLDGNPTLNFIDTSDFMTSKSVLYELAERTGQIWNTGTRRFGDWDIIHRMVMCGFRGRAVDASTNIYHWHGENLQLNRAPNEGTVSIVSDEQYDKLKREGKIR
jgi:glycosyltransferase involved in cell wall biosynthesis